MAILEHQGGEDLWPDSFESAAEEELPLDLVREQARLLWAKTGKLVEGLVRPLDRPLNENRATYAFVLSAPVISYSYRLFTVEQGLESFPLVIHADTERVTCTTMEEVRSALSRILRSETTRSLIAKLISLSRQE